MKLSSISLIASALAATAGNTIAAPGLLHARSLQQGILFGRDTDSVDLFTRNPPNPEHTRQPDDGWYRPVGPSPALPPGLLVDITKNHVPQLPLTDPGHHQHYPHLQNNVPPGLQPPVEHTRNYRQNAPPNHRHAESRRRPSSHLAPLRQSLPAPLPQHPQHPALHHPLNPQHPSSHVPPQPFVDPTRDYRRNVHGPSQASPNHGRSGPCLQHPFADLRHNRHSPQAHGRAEPRHQPPPPSAPLRQSLLAPQQPLLSSRHIENAHRHGLAGRSLFIAEATARYAATVIPEREPYYTKWAKDLKVFRDRHFEKKKTLLEGENVTNWWHVKDSAVSDENRGRTDANRLWEAMERKRPKIKEERYAKEKEIEQELEEHERKLKNPEQHQ